MILLIDAGNSRIKWACLVGGVVQPGEAVARNGDAGDIQALSLAWAPLPRPSRVLAVNVIGSGFAARLSAWVEDSWEVGVEFITAQREACGVTNAYRDAERLGADRWVALIAARQETGGPACVIDCGTAVTIDVLAANGEHLGGLIIPGIQLMRRALTGGTAGVRLDEEDRRDGDAPLFARDTAGGVIGGTRYALAAAIDRIAGDVRAAIGADLRCLLTGGDAETILPLLTGNYDYAPELVLEGLAVIAGDRA